MRIARTRSGTRVQGLTVLFRSQDFCLLGRSHQFADTTLRELSPLVRKVSQLVEDVRDAFVRSPPIAQFSHLESHLFIAVRSFIHRATDMPALAEIEVVDHGHRLL